MSLQALLAEEFAREAATTTKHLERIPDDKLDWRPHQKSFTARELASHLVECVGWTEPIFAGDELNFDPRAFQPFAAESIRHALDELTRRVDAGQRALSAASEADLLKPWRFLIGGRLRFERPRLVVFRDFTVSHLIHHRGQLSLYLRLLDVPVPGTYGPSADERS
jgi:uncharacterized damage-inducible protein DinB